MKASYSGIIGAFVSILIGCFFLAGTWSAYVEYNREQTYDTITTGHITGKHFSRAADGNSIYYINYWYPVADGRRISSVSSISKQNWDVLKTDDTLEVRYNKSNPNRNMPLYGASISLAYFFLVFILGAVFMVFGVMRLFNSLRTGYTKLDSKKRPSS
jgi:hypothetical protein